MKYFNLFRDGFLTFFSIIGASWTVVKFIDFFWENSMNWHKSNYTFSFIVFVSLCYSVYINFPLKKIRTKISGTEAYLSLKYGDILDYEGHIAASSSNFFNTSLNIISERSLLGQIIKKFFNSNNKKVEEEISASLSRIKPEEVTVQIGKNKSYPIGTIANFNIKADKKVFLMAITKISEKNGHEKIESNISYIHESLKNLWDKVERETDDGILNIVPFGSGISRAFNKNIESILYIIQSFIERSKNKRPCSELVIYIRHSDISLNEYMELKKIIKFIA